MFLAGRGCCRQDHGRLEYRARLDLGMGFSEGGDFGKVKVVLKGILVLTMLSTMQGPDT